MVEQWLWWRSGTQDHTPQTHAWKADTEWNNCNSATGNTNIETGIAIKRNNQQSSGNTVVWVE